MNTYPKNKILKNNTSVWIRPIKADDKLALYEAYENLSKHSRFMRFFSTPSHLSNKLLKYLTEVDSYNHIALIAYIQNPEKGIGVVRCIRLQENLKIAEIAVTVADEYQRQGLGRILVDELKQIAMQKGIQILRAYVHPENTKLKNVFKKLGSEFKYIDGLWVFDFELT